MKTFHTYFQLNYIKSIILVKIVQENVPQGKRPLGRPKLRWEDRVKEDIEKVKPGTDWKELALDRETWRQIC